MEGNELEMRKWDQRKLWFVCPIIILIVCLPGSNVKLLDCFVEVTT